MTEYYKRAPTPGHCYAADGDQVMIHDSAPQSGSENESASTNPQALVQALLLQSYTLPGYEPLQRPDFVHPIS